MGWFLYQLALQNTKLLTPARPPLQNKPYNDKSDVWSMGCLLYELASLKCPFDARDMRGLVVKILRGAFPPLPR